MQMTAINAAGLANAVKRLDPSAESIASTGLQKAVEVDPLAGRVDQINLAQDVLANVAAIRAADAAEGTLLDTFA